VLNVICGDSMIRIKGLKKDYGKVHALKGIDLTLKGRITAIIGRNGAGKTTLMRILSTQLMPTEGTAEIDGHDVIKDTGWLRKTIVSIPQEASPISVLTPYEQIKLYLIAKGMDARSASERTKRALKVMSMSDAANMPADELSGGMKRKVFVAMALAYNSAITFMDEPTTGLDPISRLEVWSAIKKLNGSVIITTHYMEEAQDLADDVVMVESGKVLEHGSVKDLLSKFNGKIRIESTSRRGAYNVGGLGISYVGVGKADAYLKKGYTARQITLEDLFIVNGVYLES